MPLDAESKHPGKQAAVPITGVWLRTSGDHVQVLLEIDGRWRLINDELVAEIYPPGRVIPIGHITEPLGILKAPTDPIGQTS